MQVKIHSVQFKADVKLENFIEEKVGKLNNFYDQIIGSEVFLRLENTNGPENKITEIRLSIPGNDLFAKKQSKTFEEATDQAVEALRRQIRKHKDKVK
jgi:putative sigma-54 modulation protein